MEQYMVVRKDLLGQRLKSSGDYLPKVVVADSPEDALEKVFAGWSDGYGYRPPYGREFVVVNLHNAFVISLKPKQDFTYEVRDWRENNG